MTAEQERDDPTQPPRSVPGYRKSLLRSPLAPPWPRTSPVEAPASFGAELANFPSSCDLSIVSPGRPRALGQLIVVTGRVVDERGRPIRHALLECWQANSAGKYLHAADPSPVPVDPNFEGVGRIVTDAEGRYQLRTIKPGGYAVPYDGDGQLAGWWRPPHIHFSIFGDGFGKRLVTQMYFQGEPLNGHDLLLNSIRDERARARLVSTFDAELSTADGALGYRHDFVLGGNRETPLEDDHI
ncbi:MAG: dioxygenase family protein [Gemmatimonadales bacterium]